MKKKINFIFNAYIQRLNSLEFFHTIGPRILLAQRMLEIPNSSEPWKSNDRYFEKVRCSLMALMKMTEHVHRGSTTEVMGLLLGKAVGTSLVIEDCFALPVEGTETRVNAQEEANEFIVAYLESLPQGSSSFEKILPIGWYHSHPGYGCWLSGIDVATQRLQQQFNDPFVAVVIDPLRTASSSSCSEVAGGKVDIGAFRTFSKSSNSSNHASRERQNDAQQRGISSGKMQDFGAHFHDYYSLPIEYFFSDQEARFINAQEHELCIWKDILLDRRFVQDENAQSCEKIEVLCGEIHNNCLSLWNDKRKRLELVGKSREILQELQMGKCTYETLKAASEFVKAQRNSNESDE